MCSSDLVTPVDDASRECGCNSDNDAAAGSGIYMGGYYDATRCTGRGGGFAGPRLSGAQKGGLDSIGFVLKIRGPAVGLRSAAGSFSASTVHASTSVQRVVASKQAMVNSDTRTSMAYSTRRIAGAPVLLPDGGSHAQNTRQVVGVVGSGTGESRSRFTVNSSQPTSSMGVLGNQAVFSALAVASSYTVKAIGYKAGWADSDVTSSVEYTTLGIAARPVFAPDGDSHLADSRSVQFSASSATEGSTLKYVLHSQAGAARSTTVAQLDGNNYLELTELPAISTRGFTMAGWFKTATQAVAYRSWMGMDALQLRVELHSNGKPRLMSSECNADSISGCSNGDGSTVVQDTNWHHLVISSGDGFVKLYVDEIGRAHV